MGDTFIAIADYFKAKGQTPIKDKIVCGSSGPWEFAVNGFKEDREITLGSGVTHKIPPFTCYIEFNGWPAGEINPYGGWIAAGEAANEKTFCEALVQQPVPQASVKEKK